MLAKSFGSCRFFYNYALNLTSQTYKETGKGLSRNDIINLLPDLKKEYEWLKEPPSQALQQVALNLSSAFLNFFAGRGRYPRFKKKQNRQSIRLPQGCKLEDDHLKLPKFGKVYCKVSRQPTGKLKSVTVSQTPSGQYYASCLFDDGTEKPEQSSEGKAVGVDLGISHFAITSDGSKHGSPKYYRQYEQKLARNQKELSRKQKGSNNRNQARTKVARVHEKITRCREDFLHKLSRNLVDGAYKPWRKPPGTAPHENQVIVVENLAVMNIVRNSKLAKSISDAGWGQFCTLLKYKCEWEGKTYIEVDRFFPSSKTCNHCLHQVDSLPLEIRNWECPSCGTEHDRDVNAAKNIRDEGLRVLRVRNFEVSSKCKTHSRQAAGRVVTASGQRVRPSKGTAFSGIAG